MTNFFDRNQVKINKEFLKENSRHVDYSLLDIVHGDVPHTIVDQELVDHAFVSSLNELLKINDITSLAKEILELERTLARLEKHIPIHVETPTLEVFYHQVGPVFIQLFVEVSDVEDHETLQREWLKAVRIAIEEELVFWQEKNLKN